MRKNIFLIVICFLCLVSCKSSDKDNAKNTPTAATTPIITPEPTVDPAPSAKNNEWAEAYADFFMQDDYPPYFMLLDVDFDGIPELFFYVSGYGANMWVYSVLHFSEHGTEQINIEDQIPAQFELYKDKQTGETRWMTVMNSFRSSFSYYHYEWNWIDFNDFSDINTEFFFKWDLEAVIIKTKVDEYEVFYYLYENMNEMAEVGYEEIEKRQQELFSRYELIETHLLYAYISDFVINSNAPVTAENLDRKAIVEFLLQWEIK